MDRDRSAPLVGHHRVQVAQLVSGYSYQGDTATGAPYEMCEMTGGASTDLTTWRMPRVGRGECRVVGVSTVNDMGNTVRSAPNRALVAAMWLTMAGGVVGIVADLAKWPVWLSLVGATAFIVGTVTAVGSAFGSSRRDGTSVVRSLGSAVKFGFRWLWEFMP
jgi:hypothetical protein